MMGTSLASMTAAQASGDKAVGAVFKPAQAPIVKGPHEEQVEALQEEQALQKEEEGEQQQPEQEATASTLLQNSKVSKQLRLQLF